MKVERFEKQHLAAFGSKELPGMDGFTLVDQEPVASLGFARMPWGLELWILVKPEIPMSVRVVVARMARWAVGNALHWGEPLFAHAAPGNERWLSWLGFEQEDSKRWRIESWE